MATEMLDVRWHVSEFSPHRKERHRLLIIVNGFINN